MRSITLNTVVINYRGISRGCARNVCAAKALREIAFRVRKKRMVVKKKKRKKKKQQDIVETAKRANAREMRNLICMFTKLRRRSRGGAVSEGITVRNRRTSGSSSWCPQVDLSIIAT